MHYADRTTSSAWDVTTTTTAAALDLTGGSVGRSRDNEFLYTTTVLIAISPLSREGRGGERREGTRGRDGGTHRIPSLHCIAVFICS